MLPSLNIRLIYNLLNRPGEGVRDDFRKITNGDIHPDTQINIHCSKLKNEQLSHKFLY